MVLVVASAISSIRVFLVCLYLVNIVLIIIIIIIIVIIIIQPLTFAVVGSAGNEDLRVEAL
jgi:hypothetical protein